MALTADISVLSLAIQVTVIVSLLIAGSALLRSAHVDHTPKLAARREARRKPYVSPYARSLPAETIAPRLQSGRELRRLSDVLDQAGVHVQAVHEQTSSAARQIDGAEMALNRVIAEIAGVMPTVVAPTIVPRRAQSAASEHRNILAA